MTTQIQTTDHTSSEGRPAEILHPDDLRRLPKADLHCHLIGTVRASTFAELARRERLALPDDPERIFADINSLPPDPSLY